MIVDSPLLLRLPLGAGRLITGPDDAKVTIPPTIQPVMPAIQEMQNNGVGYTADQNSTLISFATQITNAVSSSQSLVKLPPGFFHLYVELGIQTDYAYVQTNIGVPDAVIQMNDGVTGNYLVGLYAVNGGAQSIVREFHLLIHQQMEIFTTWVAVALGAHLNIHASILANRIL